jgi:hypothetical protein
MTAIWLQIAWKEWREQVWKTIAVTSIALSVEGYLLVNYPAEGGAAFLASLCLVPGALFIAMGVAAGERTAGSLEFLRSLPVDPRKWALARLLAGATAVLLPLVGIVLLQLVAGRKLKVDEPTLSQLAVLAALVCTSVYLWAVAVGVDRSSELRAGVAAVCFFVGWFALALVVYSLYMHLVPSLWPVYDLLILLSPAGATRLIERAAAGQFAPWHVYFLQFVALAGAAWWSVRRYSRLGASDNGSPAAAFADRLAPTAPRPCWRSPLMAIAWKEYREARPICLAGLAIVVALMLPVMVGSATELGSRFFEGLTGGIALFGTVTAMVLGVGGHAGDLEPRAILAWVAVARPPAGRRNPFRRTEKQPTR